MSDKPEDCEIFISYKREDKERVSPFVAAFEAHKLKVWWDQDIRGGGQWSSDLEVALDCARVVVFFLSPASCDFNQTPYCHGEVIRAIDHQKLFIVRIVQFPIDKVPSKLLPFQIASLESWNGDKSNDEYKKLLADLEFRIKTKRESDDAGGSVANKVALGTAKAPAVQAQLDLHEEKQRANAARVAEGGDPISTPVVSSISAFDTIPEDETPLPPGSAAVDLKLDEKAWSTRSNGPLLDSVSAIPFDQIRAAARAGQADAQTIMALAHLFGRLGAAIDLKAAARWLERASNQGFARASAEFAGTLSTGALGKVDLPRIRSLLEQAAVTCVHAKTIRLELHLRHVEVGLTAASAVHLAEETARAGDREACGLLGWMYLRGSGVTKNYERARHWLHLAADSGDPRAQVNLGTLYSFGQGVAYDGARAMTWFRKSAAQEDAWGLFFLGWAYENGIGAPVDMGQARSAYARSAAHGDVDAQFRYGRMLVEGRGGVANPAEAIKFLTAAADQGEAAAASLLGRLYEEGRGVEKDYKKASEFFERAAKGGDPFALLHLGILFEWGRGVDKNLVRAKELFRRAAMRRGEYDITAAARQKLAYYGVPL